MIHRDIYLNRLENLIGDNEIHDVPADRVEYCRRLGMCKEDISFFLKYGSGGLNDYIWFFVPLAEHWEEWAYELREIYLYLKESTEIDNLRSGYTVEDNEGYTFGFYPEKDGLVPWAQCDCGTVFYCRTTSEKNFMIVVYGESEKYYEYDMTITEFLYRLIKGEIPDMYEYLPEDIFSNGVKYYN